MDKIELQKKCAAYGVGMAGNPAEFAGKAFAGELLGMTSMELSLGTLAEGQSVPFFHRHLQNEEVYVVLAGRGVFVLDGEEVAVAPGSIVRVAPAVSRCCRNAGTEPFVYLCAQAREGSLEQSVAADAVTVD